MIINECTIVTQAVYKDDVHRLLLKKTWNEELPSTAILMSNAGVMPSIYHADYTATFCVNALSALGYGSCSIVNCYSKMTSKLNLQEDFSELTCDENLDYIYNAAKSCDIFIYAVGSIVSTYKKVADYQHVIFERIKEFHEKIHSIEDCNGNINQHPLSRTLRGKEWKLTPFKLPERPVEKKELDKPKKKQKKSTSPNQ
jgi:hypothetical protein